MSSFIKRTFVKDDVTMIICLLIIRNKNLIQFSNRSLTMIELSENLIKLSLSLVQWKLRHSVGK